MIEGLVAKYSKQAENGLECLKMTLHRNSIQINAAHPYSKCLMF